MKRKHKQILIIWMGLLAVLLFLAVIWVIGRIKKKW